MRFFQFIWFILIWKVLMCKILNRSCKLYFYLNITFISLEYPEILVILDRRKIRLIGSNAKRRYLKKLTCKETLRQMFHLSEAPSPPMSQYSPPYTLYTCIQYTYSQREGGEEGDLTREKVRGAIVHKAGRKYLIWLYHQSIKSIKHQ